MFGSSQQYDRCGSHQVSGKTGLPLGHSIVELELGCRDTSSLQLGLCGRSVSEGINCHSYFQGPRRVGLLGRLELHPQRDSLFLDLWPEPGLLGGTFLL